MGKEEIIFESKIIFEESNGRVVSNSIVDYIKRPGVFALYGRKTEGVEFVCLNVGKSKDIGTEILYDLGCLHYVPYRNDGAREYVNQFKKQCNFNYKAQQVREYLYPYLATQYCDFRFIYVFNESSVDAEAKYARDEGAEFWRNGSPYGIKKET